MKMVWFCDSGEVAGKIYIMAIAINPDRVNCVKSYAANPNKSEIFFMRLQGYGCDRGRLDQRGCRQTDGLVLQFEVSSRTRGHRRGPGPPISVDFIRCLILIPLS